MKKKKRKFWVYAVILLIFVLYVFLFDNYGFLQKAKVNKINKKLKEDIIRLETENERLLKENEALRTDEKSLEKKAREFGLQKEGEEVFQFIEEKSENEKK